MFIFNEAMHLGIYRSGKKGSRTYAFSIRQIILEYMVQEKKDHVYVYFQWGNAFGNIGHEKKDHVYMRFQLGNA